MRNNKVILLILAGILFIGIILVCVKGFNVSLDSRAHDTLKFVFDQKFKMNDVKKVCDEVFKDKEYEIKTVEIFSDAVYIISPSITELEEKTLLEKLNNLYQSEENKEAEIQAEAESEENANSVENESQAAENSNTIFDKLEEGTKYELYHDAKVRIRDMVKPYFIPSVVSSLIIVFYMAIKYRELNNKKIWVTICQTLGEMLVILLEIMAIVAIFRIPFSGTLIPILMFIIVICLCIKFSIFEKQLKEMY